MENNQITVLVTGFGPFGKYKSNPSWEAVKLLPNLFKNRRESQYVNLIVIDIPVAYELVTFKITDLWEKYKPSIMIHVGVSHAATCLTIERQASSKGYTTPDILNRCPKENDVDNVTLKSNCNVDEICEIINKYSNETNCKAVASNDAGKYLCEYIFYKSLALKAPQVLFVHIPESNIYSHEQTAEGLLKIVLYLIDVCER